MRITSGKYRGLVLDVVIADTTRQTMDKIRLSVLNTLNSIALKENLYFNRCLDLFAGSGAFGLDMHSRFGVKLILNDNGAEAFNIIKNNLIKMHLDAISTVEIYNLDYDVLLDKLITSRQKVDVVFLDPPYTKYDYNLIVKKIKAILDKKAIIICESLDSFIFLEDDDFIKYKEMKFGNKKLTYFLFR